jgi:HD-like signal output (HDOD) protein/CheY-like chemotaxis protein
MRTVLIIEDDAVVRALLADAVRRAGYAAAEAGNGAEGLRAINQHRPDAVVLDLQMPIMDGLTMLRQVRGSSAMRSLPVIILTTDSSKQTVVEAAKLGVQGYLLKSHFVVDSLLEAIGRHCPAPAAAPLPSHPEPKPSSPKPVSQAVAPAPPPSADTPAAPAVHTTAAPAVHTTAVTGPADDPVAALRNLKPLMTRTEVMERVEACEQLRAFSPTVSQLLSMTANPNTSMERVIKVIAQDHAVALKILKLANSVVYTRGEPVTSVKNAVLRIGMENIRQAVLNISVMDHFTGTKFADHLSLAHFWEHAISTGLIAAEVTHARSPKEADSAFTCGLLHDVGRLIYVEQLGEAYSTVLRTAWLMELPVEQVESRLLLLNHADVMDKVLHAWKFPKDLINPLVFHHLSAGNIRQVAVNQMEAVATMSLANRISHALLLGNSGNLTIYPFDDLCHLLRLDPKVIRAVEQDIPGQTADMKLTMLSHSGEANWPPVRDECLKKLDTPFKPLFLSIEPQFDAYGILCRTLTNAGTDDAPNVAVVHITHARDRVPLTTKLKQAEAEENVTGLPLVILSPSGKLTLEDGFMASRTAQHLSTPLVLPRFIRAIHKSLRPRDAARAAAA